VPAPGLSDEPNGDQKASIEALMQALSAFVDRLKQDEPRVESDTEQNH
jgi:hypothetical protein